jgi:hypothetical protein
MPAQSAFPIGGLRIGLEMSKNFAKFAEFERGADSEVDDPPVDATNRILRMNG